MQRAEQLELRIDLDAQRRIGQIERERLRLLRHLQLFEADGLGAVDRNRHLQHVGFASLLLGQGERQSMAIARTLDRNGAERQFGRAGAQHPLVEESAQLAIADGLEGDADVVERGAPESVVAIEALHPAHESLVADHAAQHVPGHGRLAVADRLRRGVVARAEFREREILADADVVGIGLQRGSAVFIALASLFGNQVVGHVGGQSLAPVARFEVDEDAVAPPVVQQLVRVGGMQDEGEADDLRAEQGERRHAVAGFPEILDQRELRVRVGADQLSVHLKVLGRGFQIAIGERIVLFAQEGHRLDCAGVEFVFGEGGGDDVDFLGRRVHHPGIAMLPVTIVAARRGSPG